ncbi:TerD domain-containing protein [Frankia sp. CNm7]|uniref:TerD domain-containing protein n=1 Tax=Frankia nepalensis TaxID=1836974 RepID=A0A937R5A6_9ACTN|nr:TerD family protein [Frankia nepalensis]MBL7495456.1 TerD domain-containing protein [Frankia nepalensis]MBL7521676.1 TerD domain-containing protein [Frankia nepalensis]MBL7626013.1 TerD domain-containing protein [Frankia nepalensis]
MTVLLPKGGNVLLSAASPGLERVQVDLGWRDRPGDRAPALELDGLVVVERAGGDGAEPAAELLLAHQAPNPAESPRPPAATHEGAELATLVVTLAAIPAEVSRLQLGAVIVDAAGRRQTFRSVRGAFIRVSNPAGDVEIAHYDVEPETGQETALLFGELYRHPSGWKFRAVGQGFTTGLAGFADPRHHQVMAARPADVAGFLTRTSPTRSRRRVTDHLHPPPAPAAMAAPNQPAAASGPPLAHRPSTAPPRPADHGPRDAARAPAPPVRPAPPVSSTPARPAARSPLDLSGEPGPPAPLPPRSPTPSPSPAAEPARRSPLDLGGDGSAKAAARAPGTPAGRSPLDLGGDRPAPTPAGAARPGGAVVFGEQSSRHRQRLEHVTALDDDHPATAWTAEKRGSGSLTVTLRWTQLTNRSGLPRPSDIQLGCFWQAFDGAAGVLQTLGGATSAPGPGAGRQVLALAPRDERDGQTMFVDLRALPTFKRFFVFAYGLHGAPAWTALRPVLTVSARTGETLTIRLDDASPTTRTCVVASFHLAQDDLVIRREHDCLDGPQAEAAARYGWALDWNPDGMTVADR